MGAGNLIGSIWNTILAGGLWVVLGKAMDVLCKAFNYSLTISPSIQDFVTGFTYQQTIWSVILVLVFVVIWLNYLLNENSLASGGV